MRQLSSDGVVLCLLAAAMVASHAVAPGDGPAVARVSSLDGSVTLLHRGSRRLLKRNDELLAGDVLVAEEGQARLVLRGQDTFDLYPHESIAIRNHDSGIAMVERWIKGLKTRIAGTQPGDTERWLLYSDNDRTQP